jgi:sugar/nucleoside kinase (ribokinase family)
MTLEYSTVDYLIIGHVAKDITADGPTLGGTVSYASRTALSMGYRVGIITSCEEHFDLKKLEGIQIFRQPSSKTTTFENIYSQGRRTQKLLARAADLGPECVPSSWLATDLIHLGPIACEVDPTLIEFFPSTFIGITPQGWLRKWDPSGHIQLENWQVIRELLSKAEAVVLSIEDMRNDESAVQEIAQHCNLLVVTRGAQGASLFWKGQRSELPTMEIDEIDSTGSGDIFAAVFFIHLFETGDPYAACQFANHAASMSIARRGIQSTPTTAELESVKSRFEV